MRTILALATLELRRFLADRFNLFFVFVLPLMLVGVLGLQTTSAPAVRVSVLAPDATAGVGLTELLTGQGVEVTEAADRAELESDVGDGRADLGLVLTGGDASGDPVTLEQVSVGTPDPLTAQVATTAAQGLGVEQARLAVLREAGLTEELAQESLPGPEDWEHAQVQVSSSGGPSEAFAGAGQFGVGATGQLLLFVFLNTLTASAAMISARRSGAVRRGLAAPVTPARTVTGLALGRLVIALFQAGWIIGMSSLLFGVTWGSLPATAVVVAVFGLIASGLALLIGVVMDSEGPASGVSVGAGMILAAVGGCMLPLELFPDGLRTVAHLTPHAWGYEALAEITRRGGGVLDILPQLGVLLAMAALVLGLGAWMLRRSLERAM